jgi:Tol biopolymer transport system component
VLRSALARNLRSDREAARRRTTLAVATAGLLALGLALPGAAQYQDVFGKNKIQYRQFDWKIYHSPHFDVYFYSAEEPLLQRVVSFAESAYDRLSRTFDHQIEKPIPLIFFATHSAFEQNNIILNFIPEGIGAFASPARNRMVLPVDLPDAELFQLISHELTHVFQYSILYEDRLGRGIASVNAPQWFMEGMASYMAKDEGTADKMFLRDAVVNDRIPSITQRGVSGFMAYRFGHAAFDYIEERWGMDGFRDFLYEFRNTIGGRPDRAIQRAFKVDPEDFDLEFRRWLRKKYLPQLVETGEPSDFGRPFRDEKDDIDEAISPEASPSGDLVAALAVTHGDVDIVLYDTRKRRPIANLTKGFPEDYQYIVSQYVSSKARMGRDLGFSPDGNHLAVFVKRERGRSLAVFDVLHHRLERMIDMKVEQQNSPAYSPDGSKIVFSGNLAGQFDIFQLDLASGEVSNLTDDAAYDGAPVYSPDGASIVYSSTVGEDHAQLFRLDLADPTQRERLTRGEWSDQDATFSSDGSRIYFTSDRTGAFNIWGLDLVTGEVTQYTNVVTGCLMPTVLRGEDGHDRVVYSGFWKGDFDLYVNDLENPIGPPQQPALAEKPPEEEPRPQFQPDIQVTLDKGNESKYQGFKLFLEDGGGGVGVTSDQLFIGQAYLSFSDYLGNRRVQVLLNTVDTFSDFDIQYIDLSHRSNWGVHLFDTRDYYVIQDPIRDGEFVNRQQVDRTTALIAFWSYPFDTYHRFDIGGGAMSRSYTFLTLKQGPVNPGESPYNFVGQSDDFVPLATASFTGDSTVQTRWGPIDGGRYQISTQYGYDTKRGGALTWTSQVDFRRYLQISARSNLAARLFLGVSKGNFPGYFYLGGFDTIRGYDFRTVVGDRAFALNLEYRFPLLDALISPVFDFRGIRGRVFVDVGGAWFDSLGQGFRFWNGDDHRLQDARSSYGWGLTVRFLGLDLNWDFAQDWDFRDSLRVGLHTSFWIGARF